MLSHSTLTMMPSTRLNECHVNSAKTKPAKRLKANVSTAGIDIYKESCQQLAEKHNYLNGIQFGLNKASLRLP